VNDDPETGGSPTDGALDESAEELYEMAPCGYLSSTISGRIVKVNRTLTDWLGYSPEELTSGKRFVDVLTIGGKIFYETHFSLLLRMQKAVDEIALDLVCKDGRVLPTLINARQKRNAENEPILNRFTVFNASERRLYERQLLAARDLFRTTLASIGDGVIATDADGMITFMNPVAEELSGWESDASLGKPIDQVLILAHETTDDCVENPIAKALHEGVVVGMANHTVLVTGDGRRIPIDDSASPIRDDAGQIIGGVIVFRDISAQRSADKALLDAHEKLEKRAAELRRSNEDLSQFAHVASHDLRSPLNTIVQFTQLLELKYGNLAEGKELLAYVTSAATRMRRLIDDLLSYATASGDRVESPPPVDTNALVRTAIENLRSLVDESGAVVTQDELPSVAASETSLVQIFQNLIGNAIIYRGSAPPRIHLSAAEQGHMWLFSCNDNGIGIAPEYQTQVFAAFRRLHGAERPGSGIGLAVCKKLVERYGGAIWVESISGQGSTFYFTLPKIT
jgi:PAS domain S-box-containing protein